MTIIEMLGQSGVLTVLGMCVVFSFLIIMIGAMTLLHSVIHALGLDVTKKDASATGAVDKAAVSQDMHCVVAAIATAIRNYRSNS